jgi:hypothetical protein
MAHELQLGSISNMWNENLHGGDSEQTIIAARRHSQNDTSEVCKTHFGIHWSTNTCSDPLHGGESDPATAEERCHSKCVLLKISIWIFIELSEIEISQ